MLKDLVTDTSLLVYSVCIWLGATFLALITYVVYWMEASQSVGSSASMWLISVPLWLIAFYSFLEFCFIVIEHGAKGHREYPVLDVSHLSLFRGPKKVLGIGLVVSLVLWGYAQLGYPEFGFFKVLFVIYTVLLGPAICISIALHGSVVGGLNPLSAIKTALEIGAPYLLLLILALFLAALYYLLFRSVSAFSAIYFLVLLWATNMYIFGMGRVVYGHSTAMGIQTDIDQSGDYQLSMDEAEKECGALMVNLFRMSTKNRLETGLNQLKQTIARYSDVEPSVLWLMVWNRAREWDDWVFLESVTQQLIKEELARGFFGDAWSHAEPFILKEGFFPFESAQDCYLVCSSGVPIEAILKAKALTIAAKHFANDLNKPAILLLLARTYYFELQNDRKARNICLFLNERYPELCQESEYSNLLEIVLTDH